MTVSKRTRYEVMRRDNYTCRYCRSDEGKLTIDHVTPTALGGSDAPSNLVACCKDCNTGKSSASPDDALVAQATQDAADWALAVQEAAVKRREERLSAQSYTDALYEYWGGWTSGSTGLSLPKAPDWQNTLRGFYAAGLARDEVEEAINIAMSKNHINNDRKWKYFCGVANTMIREMNDDAATLYEAGR